MSKLVDFEFLTVLVIDDNSFMRRTLNKLLSGFGFKNILETDNGAEALKMLKQFNVDLILLDLVMDPIDGIEFMTMMRKSSDIPNPLIPVIMLTGHTEKKRVCAARDAGINEFLAKPVSANDLLKRIIHVINHPREFVESPTYFGPDRRRLSHFKYTGPERRAEKLDSTQSTMSDDDVEKLLAN